jgi:hypothetical protein
MHKIREVAFMILYLMGNLIELSSYRVLGMPKNAARYYIAYRPECIEFLAQHGIAHRYDGNSSDKTITVSLTQKRYINRVKMLAEKHPNLVEIVAENDDGSLCAHLPIKALHLFIYASKTGGFSGVDEEDEEEDEDIEQSDTD